MDVEKFTGDPRDNYVIRFRAAMAKCGRYLAADQTVSAFVRAGMPLYQAQQTLAQLTLAIEHIPQPRRNTQVKLTVVKGDKKT